ncbi:hypothetical protein C8R44DRAFT_564848, partial [Mycena epipterygia]
MLSFNVFGFFALAGGKQVATTPPGATYGIHHIHYMTSLKTLDDNYLSTSLRVYSASGDATLPDNTIAFVVAKVFAPTGRPIELDGLFMMPVSADVDAATYQA